eukprot:2597438-Rhodomonas_salina.2
MKGKHLPKQVGHEAGPVSAGVHQQRDLAGGAARTTHEALELWSECEPVEEAIAISARVKHLPDTVEERRVSRHIRRVVTLKLQQDFVHFGAVGRVRSLLEASAGRQLGHQVGLDTLYVHHIKRDRRHVHTKRAKSQAGSRTQSHVALADRSAVLGGERGKEGRGESIGPRQYCQGADCCNSHRSHEHRRGAPR